MRAYDGTLESKDSEEVSFVARSPEPTTYTISTASGDHGSLSPGGPVVVTKDSSQTFTIIPETGYHVVDVNVDGLSAGAISSYTFSPVICDHTIDASFAVDTYIISATAGANGHISPAGSTSVDYGSDQTFSIAPHVGYHVASVIVDGVAKGPIHAYTFDKVAGNHTIVANFAADTYAITASAGANGSIAPAGVANVVCGGAQTYTMTSNRGYHIARVAVDGQTVGAPTTHVFYHVTKSHSIVVNFE